MLVTVMSAPAPSVPPGRGWLLLALLAGTVAVAAPRYEPIKITQAVEVEFPSRRVMHYIDKGEARVMIMVDEQGRLADWIVTAYTNPLFAKSALDAIPQWKYEAARLHGQPVVARAELRFIFENNEKIRIISGEMEVARRFKAGAYRNEFERPVCRLAELDAAPEAEVEVAPMSPERLGARAPAGEVVVDYLVDAEGRVRMPMIVSSDDAAFSQSVLLAMSEWKYSVPRRNGEPVIAWLRYRFEFKAPEPVQPTATERRQASL